MSLCLTLPIQAPALKAAMAAAKLKARKAAIEAEKLSQAAAVALAREEAGLSLRRKRSASSKASEADAAGAGDTVPESTADGAVVQSEPSRRCELIKSMLFLILEELPNLPGRATHGEGRAKWRNAVAAAVAQEDWRALLPPALTLSQDVQMVGMAYESTIGNVGSKKKKDDPDPDPGGKHHRTLESHVHAGRLAQLGPGTLSSAPDL